MSNPNQSPTTNGNANDDDWNSLGEVEFSPVSVTTDEVSKIALSDSPMGKGKGVERREDKRVVVTDASGAEKTTSNVMVGYNEKGVQFGDVYLSSEQFRKKALESLEKDVDDKFLYFVRRSDGKRFAEPREVVDDMMQAIVGVGPEATLSDNPNITNQDARSVEFSGPNGETQKGIFMLGNDAVNMPNGTYAEAGVVESAIGNYAKATKKEEEEPTPLEETPLPPEQPPIPPEEPPLPSEQPPIPPEQPPRVPRNETVSEEDLRRATLNLAEAYAKNRRLIVGPVARAEFVAAKQEYQRLLTEHLSSMGRAKYSAEFKTFSSDMQAMADELAAENIKELTEFVGGDLEHPLKTPEEIEAKREELRRAAEAKMKEKYPDKVENLETAVTSDALEEYTRLSSELEEATIEALDNGSLCRKVVSKIINNKWVKRGLTVAAAAGFLAVGFGITKGVADGSLAVSVGYTASGIVAGALRGGLVGALMSRQSSKTSSVRGYGERVARSVQDKVQAGEDTTAESLASGAMADYTAANRADLSSNRITTAVAAGLGAAFGAAASGIHVDNVVKDTTTEAVQTGTIDEKIQIGTTPEHTDIDLTKIDVTPGSGIGEAFTDLGGDPSKIGEAVKIAHQFDAQHGMVPGSNGVVPGVNGEIGQFAHAYPGTIDTWPEEAREYITQVAQEWAKNGLIGEAGTGGEPVYINVETPIYSAVEKTIIRYIPNLFYNAIVQAEAALIVGDSTAAVSE